MTEPAISVASKVRYPRAVDRFVDKSIVPECEQNTRIFPSDVEQRSVREGANGDWSKGRDAFRLRTGEQCVQVTEITWNMNRDDLAIGVREDRVSAGEPGDDDVALS